MNKFERTEQLIGKDNFKKLQNSKVIVLVLVVLVVMLLKI